MAALLGNARAEDAIKCLANGERRTGGVRGINDSSEVALDCLEACLEETTDECVVSDGECHGGFGSLIFVRAGESTDDKATVVGGVFPKFL